MWAALSRETRGLLEGLYAARAGVSLARVAGVDAGGTDARVPEVVAPLRASLLGSLGAERVGGYGVSGARLVDRPTAYVLLRREGERLGRPSVRTLYVGGGTPSLLEPDEIASLDAAMRDSFDLALVEATVEANPATLDRARLEAWRALGITRVSLGAQSLSA